MELDQFLNNIQIDDTAIRSNVVPTRRVLEYFIENNSVAVSFTLERTFVVNNQALLEENTDGFYLFDVPITSSVDIARDFEANVQFDLLLGDTLYSRNNTIVVTNSQYCNKQVRLYLDPNNLPEHIQLSYTGILLEPNRRRELTQIPRLLSGELQYREGMVFVR